MGEQPDGDGAEAKIDFAEDRTILANERTFAGWLRTGLAAIGIGIGFNALFQDMNPSWLPKAIASTFILVGMAVFFVAMRNYASVRDRLNSHSVRPVRRSKTKIITLILELAATALIVGIWFLI